MLLIGNKKIHNYEKNVDLEQQKTLKMWKSKISYKNFFNVSTLSSCIVTKSESMLFTFGAKS